MSARIDKLIQEFPPPVSAVADMLKLCGEARKAIAEGSLDSVAPEELFYLTATGVETLAEDDLDDLFDKKYREPLAKIREEQELEENKFFDPEKNLIPPEYTELMEAFRAEKRETLKALFEKEGDGETAELVVSDYEAYVAKREEGKAVLFARDPLLTMQIPSEFDEEEVEEETESEGSDDLEDPFDEVEYDTEGDEDDYFDEGDDLDEEEVEYEDEGEDEEGGPGGEEEPDDENEDNGPEED